MHATVAITVSDIQVAGGGHHHLGRLIERTGRARNQRPILFASRIGMFPPFPKDRQWPPIERELERNMIVTVREIDDVV
jgi:hypothetical protein